MQSIQTVNVINVTVGRFYCVIALTIPLTQKNSKSLKDIKSNYFSRHCLMKQSRHVQRYILKDFLIQKYFLF